MATLTVQPSNLSTYIVDETDSSGGAALSVSTISNRFRALLKYDFSALPAGATITGAIQTLYYESNYGTPAVGRTYVMNRCTRTDFTETATWITRDGSNNWTTAGGDFTATGAANATMPIAYGTVDWDVTSIIQYAQANTSKIAYFLLKDGTEGGLQFGANFTPRVGAITANRPKLVITYTSTVDYVLALDPGSYAITGASLGTAAALSMNAVAGSFAITGADIGTKAALSMSASPGSYTITGLPIGFAWKKFIQRLLGLKFGANLHYGGGSKPD
jgi:hypothetical protein